MQTRLMKNMMIVVLKPSVNKTPRPVLCIYCWWLMYDLDLMNDWKQRGKWNWNLGMLVSTITLLNVMYSCFGKQIPWNNHNTRFHFFRFCSCCGSPSFPIQFLSLFYFSLALYKTSVKYPPAILISILELPCFVSEAAKKAAMVSVFDQLVTASPATLLIDQDLGPSELHPQAGTFWDWNYSICTDLRLVLCSSWWGTEFLKLLQLLGESSCGGNTL